MADERMVITESGFLLEFLNQHVQRQDRPFCFILGAGVSRPSGIPTGGEMAELWLREMYELGNFEDLPLNTWATADRLGIADFSVGRLSSFYPQLYYRRYGNNEQQGYAFLESQMEGKEPSFGYSVLAYLLSETPHRVVVTTNFDNLVADALSIHASRFPLVIGHDSLAQYAAVELRRPLVAKIHGALGFAPKSSPEQIVTLPQGWRTALRRIFERHTPIVIGYDGNDGSLMTFLDSLPEEIPDRVFWCVYAPDASPADVLQRVPARVREYVQARRGYFTPIRGFDELMAKILSKLREKGSVPDLYERLKERARKREQFYDEQQRRIFEVAFPKPHVPADRASNPAPSNADSPLAAAVSAIADSRKEKPWWVWSQEAFDAPDSDRKEAILLQGIQALPQSADILSDYALFLEQERRDIDKAEEYYQRAIKVDPQHARSLAFYADFLESFRNDMDRAESLFRSSLEIDPDNGYTLTTYGRFLETVRHNANDAEAMYLHSLEVQPNDPYTLTTYGQFLENVRKDMTKAETHYQRALDVSPNYLYNLTSYGNFLETVRKDWDKAEILYQRLVELDPEDVESLKIYARFLRDVRHDDKKAEEYEKRALAIDSEGGADR